MQNQAYWKALGMRMYSYGRSGRKGVEPTQEQKLLLKADQKTFESACQAMDKDIGTGELQKLPTESAVQANNICCKWSSSLIQFIRKASNMFTASSCISCLQGTPIDATRVTRSGNPQCWWLLPLTAQNSSMMGSRSARMPSHAYGCSS